MFPFILLLYFGLRICYLKVDGYYPGLECFVWVKGRGISE